MKKKSNTLSIDAAALKALDSDQNTEIAEGILPGAPTSGKSETKVQLKEARKFFRYTKKLLKKAKKVFRKTSRKKDPNLYEIVKFNFHEAKRRKKEQKLQLSELKKKYKNIKVPL